LGLPIASTAPMASISDGFTKAWRRFACDQGVLWVDFVKGARKDDIMHQRLARFTAGYAFTWSPRSAIRSVVKGESPARWPVP
jgi:hypothetical protein